MSGYRVVISENHLEHNGILGMKWGVRNGPPYPLGSGQHSKSEIKAGYKKSLGGKKNENLYGRKTTVDNADHKGSKSDKKFELTDQQKKYLKTGAIVVGAAVATYGLYKLGSSDKLGDIGLKGSAAVDRILKRNRGAGDFINSVEDLSISTGFGINSKSLSIAESCKKVNPGYASGNMEYRANCFSAVTADILNRTNKGTGLDVVARPATSDELHKNGMSFVDLLKPYDGSITEDLIIKKDKIVDAKNSVASEIVQKCNGENGFGIIRLRGKEDSSVGHYIKWEIENGECIFSDSLSGTIGADRYFQAISSGKVSRGLEYARIDGLAINPSEIKKLVNKS